MTAAIKFVCNECGADDSIHTLAYVRWNQTKQDWEFDELWDSSLRCSCGRDDNFREEPVTDLKVAAQHAIRQLTRS